MECKHIIDINDRDLSFEGYGFPLVRGWCPNILLYSSALLVHPFLEKVLPEIFTKIFYIIKTIYEFHYIWYTSDFSCHIQFGEHCNMAQNKCRKNDDLIGKTYFQIKIYY